ncbi:MAG TPA: LPXTG cell wall anchor domain-containing protein [Flavisolibacter sp.]|jgi:LPXTG-motif cell wall-anchored protein|nr:LPXTG cell wall anchor domain-containing protein [Flavisolibacter sp.]
MKGNYFAAAGLAIMGFALYYFLRKRKTEQAMQPQKENERHHLTNAFAKAKQVAVGK